MSNGEGKLTTSETGEFIHTGGWLFVHDNNSVEIKEYKHLLFHKNTFLNENEYNDKIDIYNYYKLKYFI